MYYLGICGVVHTWTQMIAKNPQGQNAAANAAADQSHGPNAKRVRLAPPHPGNNSGSNISGGNGPPDFHGQHVGQQQQQQPHVPQHVSSQQQQQQQQQHVSQSGNSNHGHGHHPGQHPSQQSGNMQGGMHPNYSNHPGHPQQQQQQSHPQQNNSFNQRFWCVFYISLSYPFNFRKKNYKNLEMPIYSY